MGSYWEGRGKYEDEDAIVQDKVTKLVGNNFSFNWRDPKIAHLALFNGMKGMYYGYYNDGDDAEGAIDNNRVHGFQTLSSFQELARSLGALAVLAYLTYGGEKNLETAMDEAILIAHGREQKRSRAFESIQREICTFPKSRDELKQRVYRCTDAEMDAELKKLVEQHHIYASKDFKYFVLAPSDIDVPPEHLERRFDPLQRHKRIDERIERYEQEIQRLKKLKSEEKLI